MSLNPRITDWQGRIVWLVGASTGIGRATARAAARAGAKVIVSARTASALGRVSCARTRAARRMALDATDRARLHDAAADIVRAHGRIDLVVYCAGTYSAMRATAFDLDEALRHQQVNYVGALYMLDAVLPQLLKQAAAGQGGHLSLMASVAGYRGLPNRWPTGRPRRR